MSKLSCEGDVYGTDLSQLACVNYAKFLMTSDNTAEAKAVLEDIERADTRSIISARSEWCNGILAALERRFDEAAASSHACVDDYGEVLYYKNSEVLAARHNCAIFAPDAHLATEEYKAVAKELDHCRSTPLRNLTMLESRKCNTSPEHYVERIEVAPGLDIDQFYWFGAQMIGPMKERPSAFSNLGSLT